MSSTTRGRGWWPFHHLVETGIDSPYREWFHLSDAVRAGRRGLSAYPDASQMADVERQHAAGAQLGSVSREAFGYEAWWDLPALPKINLDHPPAREHILDVAEHWIRFGIDGWRLDVAEEVAADFWREFRSRVRAANPEAYIVAEVWHHKPEWLQGDMFDAFMNYPLNKALLGFAAQERLDPDVPLPFEYRGQIRAYDGAGLWAEIAELESVNRPQVTAVQLNLLSSHDTPRFLTFCGGDLAALRLAVLLQMTLPGAPCLYYGDEIGMEGSADPDCRRSFPTDPAEWQREPSEWMADLAHLRHSSRALREAELTLLGHQGAAIAYLRRDGNEAFVVVANAGDSVLEWDVPLPMSVGAASVEPIRGSGAGERTASIADGALRVRVPARDGMVVRLS